MWKRFFRRCRQRLSGLRKDRSTFSAAGRAKRQDRRRVENRTVGCEMRPMARAVPALLERIPVNDAANMRAACGAHVELSFAIATYRQFGEAAAQNAALAAFTGSGGFELAGPDVFGEILHGGHVFLDEMAKCVHSLTAGVVKLLPRARSL